jgi:hypothetical protein
MILIRADGVERDVDGYLTLEGVQYLVGGGVPEHFALADGRHMFMGVNRERPLNLKATELLSPSWEHVRGDALVLTADEYARLGKVRSFQR